MLMLVGADLLGGVLQPRHERETQFLDNLSNDKMHARIVFIYLYLHTQCRDCIYICTYNRADEAAFYGSTSDTDKSYLGCGGGGSGGGIHSNIWYKYSL